MAEDFSGEINQYQKLILENNADNQMLTAKLSRLHILHKNLTDLKTSYQKFREDTKADLSSCKEYCKNVRTAVNFSNGMIGYLEGNQAQNGEDSINTAISKVNLAITNVSNDIAANLKETQSYQAQVQNLQSQQKAGGS